MKDVNANETNFHEILDCDDLILASISLLMYCLILILAVLLDAVNGQEDIIKFPVQICLPTGECPTSELLYDSSKNADPERVVEEFLSKFGASHIADYKELLYRHLMEQLNSASLSINIETTKTKDSVGHRRQSLLSIFKNHKHHIFDKWENYIVEYDRILSKFRDTNVSLLEMGVQNGGSLQIWKKYFGASAVVHGVAIRKTVCELQLGDGISTYCFDNTNETVVRQHSQTYTYDIIIDDASHLNADVINTFSYLFPELHPGGYYVIEDVHTSYWEFYGGGFRRANTSVEYFKHMIDIINYYHHSINLQNLTDFQVYCVQHIRSITFVDGMIIIRKHKLPRTQKYRNIIGGIHDPVLPISIYKGKELEALAALQSMVDEEN